jgi:dTDP-4-amino-4,6-dideoxygalactose transaminase
MTAVCEQGIEAAIEVMRKGLLNRYQMGEGAPTNYLLKTEQALAKYIGTKYCLGLNSGASAIFLALKCADLPLDAPVLSNAFTFNAVPSAIVHAGGRAVLVECTDTMVIDLQDLQDKAQSSGAKYFVLSYMRGRVPDMDKIMEICERMGLYLIEDSAHAYGCEWKGRKIGTFGHSSTISTQANKVMNSGEGGFICTDDDDIMAKAIISSGCYEELFAKHCDMMPPRELMLKYRMTRVNYSIRMTNLQGAILYPQVAEIDARRDTCNATYEKLSRKLCEHPLITVPPQLSDVTPVYDSIQFTVKDRTEEQVRKMTSDVKKNGGFKLEVFGVLENARNWKSWQFIDDLSEMAFPKTNEVIAFTCDMRVDLDVSDSQIDHMVSVIHTALNATDVAVSNKKKIVEVEPSIEVFPANGYAFGA